MLVRNVFFRYICNMIAQMATVFLLTNREIFLISIGIVVYIALFVAVLQSNRRRILLLRERLDKANAIKTELEMQDEQRIEANKKKIAELENLIKKLGNENSVLRLELEERRMKLDYANRIAIIDNEKRQQADSLILGSDIYRRIKLQTAEGQRLSGDDWQRLTEMVNSVYCGFTERLFSLYNMSEQDYHVCLLIKIRMQPKDIATLTAHSKESVASTRSRLYQKIFGKKGSTRDWDDFVLSL